MTSSASRALAKVSAYLPLALTVILLVATTLFDSSLLRNVPLELIVAVCALSFLSVSMHVETRLASAAGKFRDLAQRVQDLENVQQTYLKAMSPSIQTKSLAQAFDAVSAKRLRWDRLRIFAITTQQIVTFFDSHQFSVGHCEILIHGPTSPKGKHGNGLHLDLTSYPIEMWRSLEKEGRIGKLTVRSYEFLPTQYECIFDDDILLLGLYEPDPRDSLGVRVGPVTMVESNTPHAKRMIEEYKSRYDSLFGVCADHYGPNPFEMPSTSQISTS